MNAILLAAMAPVLWGTTYLVAQHLMPADMPLWTATLRALPIGLLMLLTARIPSAKWLLRIMAAGVLNVGLFFALLFIATYRLPGGIAATLGATMPVQAIMLMWIAKGQQPRPAQLIIALLAIPGIGLLVLAPTTHLDPVGLVAALLSCSSLALGTFLSKEWGKPSDMGVHTYTGLQLTGGGVVLLIMALAFEGQPPTFTSSVTLGALWLAVMNTGLAYFIWFSQITRLTTTQLAFLGLMSPVTAVTLGQVLAGEEFSPVQWCGMTLVLLSLIGNQFLTLRIRHQPHQATTHVSTELIKD